nr:hypothetical protein [Tanacetum cinerariifolium]
MGQDRQMQMIGGNGGNQFRQYAGQNTRNLNRYNAVQNVRNRVAQNPRVQNDGIQNQIGNGNLVAVRAEGNAARNNGNQIRCYNCREVGHFARDCTARPRRRDVAYLQTQLLIAQKEEAGIQLQAEEYDLMAAAADLDEIEEVNANCILMANLQQASSSGTQTDSTPVYDSEGSAENDNNVISEVTDVEQDGEIVEQHSEIQELMCKLFEDVRNINKELSEFTNSPSWDRPMIVDDVEHSIQFRLNLKNSSNAIALVLSTEEPEYSLSMGDEHLSTISKTKSDKVISSSVKNFIIIPSEYETLPTSLIPVEDSDSLREEINIFTGMDDLMPPGSESNDYDLERDIHILEELLSKPLDVKVFFEPDSGVLTTKMVKDNSFSIDDIDYVEASPPHSELISLEEVKNFHPKDRELEDDVFCEKLSKINLLIAKIKALNANPTLSSNFVLMYPIPVKDGDSFLEKFETIPKLETFKFDIEEKSSGSTVLIFLFRILNVSILRVSLI